MKKLVCFGDSITAREISDDGTDRLTPRLRNELMNWYVINSGVSGDNSGDALLRLNRDVLKHLPDLVTVLLGANDAAAHKMVSLQEYETNLLSIVHNIKPEKVLLISPSPVDENKPRNRTNDVLRKYANVTKYIAASTGCHFIDLFQAMFLQPAYIEMLSDGLHFNESGYKFLARLIADEIKSCT